MLPHILESQVKSH